MNNILPGCHLKTGSQSRNTKMAKVQAGTMKVKYTTLEPALKTVEVSVPTEIRHSVAPNGKVSIPNMEVNTQGARHEKIPAKNSYIPVPTRPNQYSPNDNDTYKRNNTATSTQNEETILSDAHTSTNDSYPKLHLTFSSPTTTTVCHTSVYTSPVCSVSMQYPVMCTSNNETEESHNVTQKSCTKAEPLSLFCTYKSGCRCVTCDKIMRNVRLLKEMNKADIGDTSSQNAFSTLTADCKCVC